MLKSNIKPTFLKTLRDGRVQTETGSIQEAETLTSNIKDKLGENETNIQRPRNPRLQIHNIPEDISTDNIVDTLIAQNPDLGIEEGEIIPKFKKKKKNALET
jgi:hypothetical protein